MLIIMQCSCYANCQLNLVSLVESRFWSSSSYSVVLRDWSSKLSPKLNDAEKVFKDELHGPEDVVTYNGQLYTGVHGGYVVRVEKDRIVPIVKFGEKCGKRKYKYIIDKSNSICSIILSMTNLSRRAIAWCMIHTK